jgi:hypothetical protein
MSITFPRDPDTKGYTYDLTQAYIFYKIVLTLSQSKIHQYDITSNFWDSCSNAWNLTLVFGALLIYIISKPSNKRVARISLINN